MVLHLVILAAGKGTRMKSARPKVLHRVGGVPMVEHVVRTAARLGATSTIVVIGHGADAVRGALSHHPHLTFVRQEPQLGTGHALLQAEPALAGRDGTLLLLSGDVPLLRAETLRGLLGVHLEAKGQATVATAVLPQPYGYGRIVRSKNRLARIVEERDASPAQRAIHEINTGIYALAISPLFDALRAIGSDNRQGEYYLPDLIGVYRRRRLPVETFQVADADEIRGINSRTELAEVSRIVRQQKNEELMGLGVTIEDPATTYVGPDVIVGPDTIIHPGVFLEGATRIGTACEIHGGVRIVDSTLDDRVVVRNFCVIVRSTVASGAVIGPFAHLRPESRVGEEASIGNYVELKKTTIGAGSKANHLSYLGDATIGERVNIGAGTITCNFDGRQKHPTVVEDDAFIGSDTQLIAPVRVGRGAYVAAGSSITEDVPTGALGVARGRQVNKEGWAASKRRS